MKRNKTGTQWDFGELFPAEATRTVLTVTELNAAIKRLLERQIGQVWVAGEVANYRIQSSGHAYFTLRDSESQVSCVLFRSEAPESRDLIADGRRVVVQGGLTIYEPRGQYQVRVTKVELLGLGALQAAFEKLKQKLNAEGFFAMERKRTLPRYPRRVGVVTSPTGAALRDVLHVVQRRHPGLELVLAPCRVQGQGAAEEIAEAIRMLNNLGALKGKRGAKSPLDLILVTRGGGSLEDLWAFNEEAVARAIFESALPVVSAVGHEIDFTISDFVADVRAATPSAAAEIITEGVFSSREFLATVGSRIRQRLRQQLDDRSHEAQHFFGRLTRLHPRRQLNHGLQRLDDLRDSLLRCAFRATRERLVAWQKARGQLLRVRPDQILAGKRELLERTAARWRELTELRLLDLKRNYALLGTRLRLLGPEQVLARGYSITMADDTGRIIRDTAETRLGQRLRTRLKSGTLKSVVTK